MAGSLAARVRQLCAALTSGCPGTGHVTFLACCYHAVDLLITCTHVFRSHGQILGHFWSIGQPNGIVCGRRFVAGAPATSSSSPRGYQGGVGDATYAAEIARQLDSSLIWRSVYASNGRCLRLGIPDCLMHPSASNAWGQMG